MLWCIHPLDLWQTQCENDPIHNRNDEKKSMDIYALWNSRFATTRYLQNNGGKPMKHNMETKSWGVGMDIGVASNSKKTCFLKLVKEIVKVCIWWGKNGAPAYEQIASSNFCMIKRRKRVLSNKKGDAYIVYSKSISIRRALSRRIQMCLI